MRDKKLIQLYITNMCNSKCKTCTIWKNSEREELTLDSIKNIVESNVDADFVIGGGEPILHSDIDNILQYLKDNNINYTLLSNCIKNEKLKQLIEMYEIPSVTISCDGIKHDEIRGRIGNLSKIINFVEWAQYRKQNFKLSYTYSAFNEKIFKEDMNFFKLLGIQKVYFCLAQEMDLLKTDGDSFVATDFTKILEEKEMLFDRDLDAVNRIINGTKKKCDSQDSVFTIYSNGNVVRCQSFLSCYVLGNVFERNFSDIIRPVKSVTCAYDSKCNLLCQRRYD